MSLVSHALTTVARTKTFLGVSGSDDDALLENLVNSVTDFVEQFCGRRFKKTAYSNEIYDGSGTDQLLLKQYPIDSASTITVEERDSISNIDSWTALDSENYFVKYTEGIVIYIGSIVRVAPVFTKAPRHFRVSYTAGYDFDPANSSKTMETVGLGDLEYAVWKLVGTAYKNRKLSGNVESERLGDYSITFRKEAMENSEIAGILQRYKKPYVN